MATDIEIVRVKTSDKSKLTRETATGDGVSKYWQLGHAPILTTPAPEVRVNGVLQSEGVGADYTVDYDNGVITFTVVPLVNDSLEFTYYWSVWSDSDIQIFLDESSNTTEAAAKVLLAWAADAAKIAKRQTLSGGGGLGQVVVDTSVAAKELRAAAKALIELDDQIEATEPADGLTEVPWTEQVYHDQLEQSFIRR